MLTQLILEIEQFHIENERVCFLETIRKEAPFLLVSEIEHCEPENVLLITDSRKTADIAVKRGIAFCVYLNEKSRVESFQEALYCIERLDYISYRQLERIYLRAKRLPWTILTTERLIIREMTVEDVDALYEIYEDPDASRYTENLYEDRNAEIAYIKEYIHYQYELTEYGIWVLQRKEDGKLIGRAGITNREGYETAEVGYVLRKDCRHMGYAMESLQAVLSYAKKELAFEKLMAFTKAENIGSVKLLTKLGFEKYGEELISGGLHDCYMKFL